MADWIKIGTDYVDLDKVESVVKETDGDEPESYRLDFETSEERYYVDGADIPSFLREMDARVLLNRLQLRSRLSVWSVDAVNGAADGPMPAPTVEEGVL